MTRLAIIILGFALLGGLQACSTQPQTGDAFYPGPGTRDDGSPIPAPYEWNR